MARLIAPGCPLLALATLLIAASLAGPAGAQGTLSVVYRPPLISLEARDAQLDAILSEVGARTGFTVVQGGPASRRVTISIQEATLDDVLRQLLRSENHALLYRAQQGQPGGELDQVVLLGPAWSAPALAEPPRRVSAPGQPPAGAGGPVAPPPMASPGERAPGPEPSADSSGEAEPTLSDVLRSQATATLRAAELAGSAPPPAAGAPAGAGAPVPARGAAPPLSPAAQDALAAATRQAQQSLKALVDGLDAATQALQQQQAPPAAAAPSGAR